MGDRVGTAKTEAATALPPCLWMLLKKMPSWFSCPRLQFVGKACYFQYPLVRRLQTARFFCSGDERWFVKRVVFPLLSAVAAVIQDGSRSILELLGREASKAKWSGLYTVQWRKVAIGTAFVCLDGSSPEGNRTTEKIGHLPQFLPQPFVCAVRFLLFHRHSTDLSPLARWR